MITKTHFGSEIDVLIVGKDYSTCLFTKTGITNTVDNHDIQWPENKELPENDMDKMAEKITEIFNDGKTKKSNKKLAKEIQKNIDDYNYPLLSNNEKKALISILPNFKKCCLNKKIYPFNELKQVLHTVKKEAESNILNSLRIVWLEKAYIIINDRLFNSLCPDMITISWSFPTKTVKKILGESINSMVENENNYMIVINPTIDNTLTVLQVLTHEMIHVHVGNEQLHGKEFTQFAKSIGFDKPYTKLNPNDKLNNELEKVIDQLGNIPSGHIELSDNKKKQTTRNKLYMCDCQTKIRCASTLNATCNDCNSPFTLQE